MKKALKIILFVIGSLVLVIIGLTVAINVHYANKSKKSLALAGDPSPTLKEQGYEFRDLNKNGRLDIYEDGRETIEARVEDLLAQMTLEEKAGTMFYAMAFMGPEGTLHERPDPKDPRSFFPSPNSETVLKKKINHMNLSDADAIHIGRWNNAIQDLADRTRLGIPVTIATDPRHAFSTNPLAGFRSKGFTQWPEALGFGALGDTLTVRKFAEIAAREYRSVGISMALHPMADLATEPRWARIGGTFGEDARLSSAMVYHYIKGFQGDSISNSSVGCMVKHFSGSGPLKKGMEAHFEYGSEQVYPGDNFDYHLIPFRAAFEANAAAVMPAYSIPVGQSGEHVAFGFNREMSHDLLRIKMGFKGVVCSDWGIITDKKLLGKTVMKAIAWGVDDLTPKERILKAINAGLDQIGGEEVPEMIIELVQEGKIRETRIDESVRRLLHLKFQLGLFEDPFVDEGMVKSLVGREDEMELGRQTQGRAMVLLKNKGKVLPLKKGTKVYVDGIAEDIASEYGTVVSNPEEADFAIIRLEAPYQVHRKGMMAAFFHQGDLDFKGEEKARILELLNTVPTIVDLYLDRPAVVPEISEACAGLLVNFGASDKVLMDVVFGNIEPEGKLPIEMPFSMEAVYQQKEDMPYDSKSPLYSFGYGLSY